MTKICKIENVLPLFYLEKSLLQVRNICCATVFMVLLQTNGDKKKKNHKQVLGHTSLSKSCQRCRAFRDRRKYKEGENGE